MSVNRIDAALTAEKIQTVNTAFATIETELDFLIALEPSEAKRLLRLGLRNETFSRAALEAAVQNPTVIPQSVGVAAIERDKALRDQLIAIEQRAQRLYNKLNHTNVVLGAEIYAGARAIYKALRTFGRAAGLGLLIDELARRFKRGSATTPAEEPVQS